MLSSFSLSRHLFIPAMQWGMLRTICVTGLNPAPQLTSTVHHILHLAYQAKQSFCDYQVKEILEHNPWLSQLHKTGHKRAIVYWILYTGIYVQFTNSIIPILNILVKDGFIFFLLPRCDFWFPVLFDVSLVIRQHNTISSISSGMINRV